MPSRLRHESGQQKKVGLDTHVKETGYDAIYNDVK